MTKFQTIQLTNFLNKQKFTKGCSDILEYERAKKYLFPAGRPDPISDLDYNDANKFLIDYLKV